MNKLHTITAEDLQNRTYDPTPFLVDELIPEGLHILAGAPKIGGRTEDRQVLAGIMALLVRFAGAAALEFRNNPRRSPVSQPRRFVPAHPNTAL